MRAWINRLRRRIWHALAYRMLFGEKASDGAMRPASRIAPTVCIEGQAGLSLADHVFIGQFNFLEASAGLAIEEGVQITNFCSIVTHSTHRSIRLMGRLSAAAHGVRIGDIRAPIRIGAYSYIGPHSLIEAGSTLGRGSLVAAFSRVRGEHPAFAVLAGNPAQVIGDTRRRDAAWLRQHLELHQAYEDWAGALPAGVLGGEPGVADGAAGGAAAAGGATGGGAAADAATDGATTNGATTGGAATGGAAIDAGAAFDAATDGHATNAGATGGAVAAQGRGPKR